MNTLSTTAVGLLALVQLTIMVVEMFFWDAPLGRRIFRLTPQFSAATKAMAANQGLYNGFLAAGLLWGMLLGEQGLPQKLFFLGCVAVAGVFGAATVSRKIFFVQALPAAMTMALVWLA